MQRQTNVYNDGRAPIHLIVDGDTINDSRLEPGEERELEASTPGIIELREPGEDDNAGVDA
ncbi:hypothetical protein GXB81_24860 [Paraburkholderia sp. Ac-20336]|uniref:hypothetical protein n=1 Tax=Burkholderiaceae TaxID=119060 RepID=UPI001420460D|nr:MULTISPECIES: hypothetical protein [Burkholderiaceae]MBN3806262.1 hypothetical protein [Paraburkholderia sp. Ac-20336]MBN3848374.1 hypothetical protein [Paraburkholderia sp. Ac-20342]NIF53635.1 hypothetical protein [Burkholderia sp. Ax-1724]